MTAIDPESLPYRPCVGIMLLNRRNEVFVGRRIDTLIEAWQMPQGGIDAGETPQIALFREMEEEIGTRKASIIAESRGWLRYDLPQDLLGKVWKGRYRGQEQKWFLLRYEGEDGDIRLETEHPEFNAWRWVPPADITRLIVPFKRELYEAVLAEFADRL
jgi:putative (di)nucleoside polyphosphate hydrolase